MEKAPKTPRMIRFGLYEADFAAGELRKNGARIKLQDRPFEILKILIERPGEIITREEFRQRLWPADTFVDFDHSLNASINKLRQALGDDAVSPRFVATVGRSGYRFIASLSVGADASAPVLSAEARTATGTTIVATLRKQPARRWWLLGSVAATIVILIAVVSVVWLYTGRTLHPISEEDFVVLGDFDNPTGNSIFDGALKEGLAVQLAQSPFLHFVPEDRVHEALRFMGHPKNERLVLPVVRDVCERVHATAFVAGSIKRLGTHFEIVVEAVNCQSGETLARAQVEAQSQEQVLKALGQAAQIVRGDLGESLSSVRRYGVPIQEASTPSLEALKAYTLGEEERARGAEVQSIPLFANAIKFDPNFAMAYARMGAAYNNLGESQKAQECLKKAFDLREHVTEVEKLYLETRYYLIVTGEIDKAVQTYEFWKQIYPRDWTPYNGLAARYQVIGQYDKAMENAIAALRLAPDNFLPYANLASSYRSLNQFAEAKQICEQALTAKRDSSYTHIVGFEIGVILGDHAAMQREVDWARGTPREGDMRMYQAMAEISDGKLRSGRRLFQDGQEYARKEGLPENASYAKAWQALAEADMGNFQQARALAKKAATLGSGIDAQEAAAEAFALSGDLTNAEDLANDLHKRFPQHTPLNGVSLPTIRATIAIRRGSPAEAVELLKPAIPYDLSEFSSLAAVYVRGLAYLNLRSGKEAAEEFQKILAHPGIVPTSPRHSLARLGLARAYALTGEKGKSLDTYHQLLTAWKDADRDIPILQQARAEYSKLIKSK